tara:strand:+ start:1261 stop:1548 length:288 start_codon:yes stop_codon:yes gene_type:complete
MTLNFNDIPSDIKNLIFKTSNFNKERMLFLNQKRKYKRIFDDCLSDIVLNSEHTDDPKEILESIKSRGCFGDRMDMMQEFGLSLEDVGLSESDLY